LFESVGVPDDAKLIVIAGPKYDVSAQEAAILETYLKQGGSLLVMADAVRNLTQLSNLLIKFGIKLNSDLLVLGEADPRAQLFGRHFALIDQFDEYNPVTKDFSSQGRVELMIPFMRTVSEVTENQYEMKVSLVAKSSESMEKISDVEKEDDLKNITPTRLSTGSFSVLAVAEGRAGKTKIASSDSVQSKNNEKSDASQQIETSEKEIRLVVVGSSQFARNQGAQSTASNRDLFLNISNYLMRDEAFISIRPKDMLKSSLNLTSSTGQMNLVLISLVYPFLFLGAGMVYWLKRKNA
jgi:ABC-type uncharacterized transport system involved in gliding motility auxiliary subunit